MYTLKEIANKIGGEINPRHFEKVITGVSSLENAGDGDITFLLSEKNLEKHNKISAGAVIIQKELKEKLNVPVIVVPHAYIGFSKVLSLFEMERFSEKGKISPVSIISDNVSLGNNITIGCKSVIDEYSVIGNNTIVGAGAYIGRNVKIGQNCIIYPNVSVYEGCIIGDDCIIHSGAVIGSDGYGFIPYQGTHIKIPQIGGVEIGNSVEVGANVTIDRGTIHSTKIGDGTKIDNLVHIAHNVEIGQHCLIVAQVGISGSVKIGDRVTLAGQAGVVGHLKIGNDTVVAARSVVMNNIEGEKMVSGFPAIDHKEQMRIMAATKKLPEMLKYYKNNKKKG